MKSVKYLEQVKAKHGFTSDRQLSIYLKKTTGTICQYMTGARVMDDEMCLAVALDLEINPLEIIGAACIDRAEKTGQKSLFEVFMMRMAATASALLFALNVNLFLTVEKAEAAPVLGYSQFGEAGTLYYVKLKLIKNAKFWILQADLNRFPLLIQSKNKDLNPKNDLQQPPCWTLHLHGGFAMLLCAQHKVPAHKGIAHIVSNYQTALPVASLI